MKVNCFHRTYSILSNIIADISFSSSLTLPSIYSLALVDNSFQSNSNANNLEKKQRAFDKTISEWQARIYDLQSDLENAQKETRSYSAELFRVKAQLEEVHDVSEALRRENKNLAGMAMQI